MIFIYCFTVTLLVLVAHWSKKVNKTGAVAGGIITLCLLLGIGWMGLGLIGGFFLLGTLASVWQLNEKKRLGVAEKNAAQRGLPNVLANALIPGICGLLAFFRPSTQELFEIIIAAGFASATSDTLSSEMGNIYGSKYFHIISLKRDSRGKDGVISLEGLLFGVLGSALIAIVYSIFRNFDRAFVAIWLAGIAGNVVDSLLGATLQEKGYMNNHSVNFMNILFASLFAYFLLS